MKQNKVLTYVGVDEIILQQKHTDGRHNMQIVNLILRTNRKGCMKGLLIHLNVTSNIFLNIRNSSPKHFFFS
jgi:hypothetical protein